MDSRPKIVQLDTSKVSSRPEVPLAKEEAETGTLEDRVIAALRSCYDPELPVNVYELGLIYELAVEPSGAVSIKMTLTSPGCPVADALVREIRSKVEAVQGVASARVELVWDPPWDRSRMSEAARLELGLF
jgi:FeS assembly SUF system protein